MWLMFVVKNLKERNQLEDKEIEGRIILKYLKKLGWKLNGLI